MAYSTYDKTVWWYEKQINRGCKKSKIDLELFKLSEKLTILDWKQIRGKAFWKEYDKLSDLYEKNRFTYLKAKDYYNKTL